MATIRWPLIVYKIAALLKVAANNMIISGHYALAANNVAANDEISCREVNSSEFNGVV